jgi:nitroimidazol reductase NimA-like FMN-containing flavoprotein (pyridoxamine 5'-phosphate oxidase superfamily)
MRGKRRSGFESPSPRVIKVMRTRTTRPMPGKKLEKRIREFFKSQNICVLATSKNNIPRATPIEYYSKELNLYLLAESGRKIENIRLNPRVSVGIFAPYTGWLSVKGAQYTGKANIITRENDAEFMEARKVFPWRKYARVFGIKELPEDVKFLKIEPEKIEFIDISLKTEGYAARQVWKKSVDGR